MFSVGANNMQKLFLPSICYAVVLPGNSALGTVEVKFEDVTNPLSHSGCSVSWKWWQIQTCHPSIIEVCLSGRVQLSIDLVNWLVFPQVVMKTCGCFDNFISIICTERYPSVENTKSLCKYAKCTLHCHSCTA